MLKERLQKGMEVEMEGKKGNGVSVYAMLCTHCGSWKRWFRMRSPSSRSSRRSRRFSETNS